MARGRHHGHVLWLCIFTIFTILHINIHQVCGQRSSHASSDSYEPPPRFVAGTGTNNNNGDQSGFPRHGSRNTERNNDNFSPLDAFEIDLGRNTDTRSRNVRSSTYRMPFILTPPTPPPAPLKPTRKPEPPGGKYPCEWRDSCFHSKSASVPQEERNCFCDDLCYLYKDCCADKMSNGSKPRGMKKLSFSSFKCWSDTTIDPKPFYLVTKCPRKARKSESAKKCEDERDPWNFMPVSGKRTNILYKNEHCARCHRDRDVEVWGYQVNCYNLQRMQNATAKVLNNPPLFLNKPPLGCNVSYVSPTPGVRPRYCRKITDQDLQEDVKVSCPSGTDSKLKDNCQKKPAAYRFPAQLSHYIFRNEFCAMCWHINTTNLKCKSDVVPERQLVLRGPLSVSTLYNFTTGELSISENGHTTDMRVGECEDHEIYHPRLDRCIQKYARRGRNKQNRNDNNRNNRRKKTSTSITTTTSETKTEIMATRTTRKPKAFTVIEGLNTNSATTKQTDISKIDFQNKNCTFVTLQKETYEKYENGSILYRSTVYSKDEIWYQNGIPTVCKLKDKEKKYTVLMFQFGENRTQRFLFFVGTIISVGGLFLLFVVYLRFSALRKVPGKCLICFIFCLFLAQLLLLVGLRRTKHAIACFALGIASHYVWLAAFFWLNVLSFDIWKTFATKVLNSPDDNRSTRFIVYSVYAWFVPALIVGGSAALEYLPVHEIYRPYYGKGLCWITQQYPLLFMVALPMAVVIATNLVFYLMTAVSSCVASRSVQNENKSDPPKRDLIIIFFVSLILGVSWAFAFLAAMLKRDNFWYVFIVLNSVCGVFLCITLLCSKKVYRLCRDGGSPAKLYDPQTDGMAPNGYTDGSTPVMSRQGYLSYENTGAKVGSHETSI